MTDTYETAEMIRQADLEGVWVAYTQRDKYGQREVHLISAPTPMYARKVLATRCWRDTKEFKMKKITDMISDYVDTLE